MPDVEIVGGARSRFTYVLWVVGVVDCAALLGAWLIARLDGVGTMLLLAALILGLNATAGLYGQPTAWLRLRAVPGVVVVAASVLTTMRVVLHFADAGGAAHGGGRVRVASCGGSCGAAQDEPRLDAHESPPDGVRVAFPLVSRPDELPSPSWSPCRPA
jgi:hypothetical protein